MMKVLIGYEIILFLKFVNTVAVRKYYEFGLDKLDSVESDCEQQKELD